MTPLALTPQLEQARAQAVVASRRSGRLGARVPRGAALVFRDGRVETGCDLPDDAGTGACAEQLAVYRGRLEGHRFPQSIVIAGGPGGASDGGPPCGRCLQILLEFAPRARIYWGTRARPRGGQEVRELLPGAFAERHLRAATQSQPTRSGPRSPRARNRTRS